jgi:hypothetical protein
MATFKEFAAEDVKSSRAYLNQLVDILQEDISGSTTRKKYQVWVTGGLGPGVTSSLFETVFDQDFSLQTANPIFDLTVGLYSGSSVVLNSGYTIDSAGKYLFPSQTLMMREKMDIYREFAQTLLGNANSQFSVVSGTTEQGINEAMFLGFKRLFARDQVKRETFAIKLYVSAASTANNLAQPAASASIYTDISSSANKELSFGGQVSTIVDSSNVNYPVGLFYIDRGVAVLDMAKVFATQVSGAYISSSLRGTINAVNSGGLAPFTGSFNQLLASASIDNIVDHIATTRFSGSSQTAMTFQNITNINSTLFFCRLSADEFNYSSNPTFTDSDNRIIVIDEGQEESQRSFTFVTSIGLYDAFDNLLGVAKLSRPVLKDDERDLTLKVRLDY